MPDVAAASRNPFRLWWFQTGSIFFFLLLAFDWITTIDGRRRRADTVLRSRRRVKATSPWAASTERPSLQHYSQIIPLNQIKSLQKLLPGAKSEIIKRFKRDEAGVSVTFQRQTARPMNFIWLLFVRSKARFRVNRSPTSSPWGFHSWKTSLLWYKISNYMEIHPKTKLFSISCCVFSLVLIRLFFCCWCQTTEQVKHWSENSLIRTSYPP